MIKSFLYRFELFAQFGRRHPYPIEAALTSKARRSTSRAAVAGLVKKSNNLGLADIFNPFVLIVTSSFNLEEFRLNVHQLMLCPHYTCPTHRKRCY
jgi:hypothetical protein